MRIRLSLSQKKKLEKIGRENGLLFAVVFGSAAKGKKRPTSDFDVAVLSQKEPSYQLLKELFSGFSEVFKGENVDVRFLNEADPFFRFQVVREGKLIYGNREKFQEYFTYAYKSFVDDGQPLLALQRKIINKKQKELEKSLL